MKICISTKREKYGVSEVIPCTKRFFKELDVFYDDVKNPILKKTKKWNLNFHPGPPEYPGIGCFNFAIYEDATEFGSTAHIMEPRVDSGKIIGVKKFVMDQTETVHSLNIKTYESQLSLYKSIIRFIFKSNELPVSNEKWKKKPFKRVELEINEL
jgi:methionyl-tRNA formyltransferase